MSDSVDAVAIRSKTPYLDRENPLPRMNRGASPIRWWQTLLIVLAMFLDVFRVVFASFMVCILIHEAGHVVGGLLMGDWFNYVRVGPFQIDRRGKVSWRWTWNAVFNGGTSTLPVNRSALRWKIFFSTLTGPAANLLTA
jgi:hypothetical protein